MIKKKEKILSHEQYSKLVSKNKFPSNPTVPRGTSFRNQNGVIKNILFQQFSSVAIIDSKAGSVRANHYHLTDWHYAYILEGSIDYFWRPAGSLDKPQKDARKIQCFSPHL